MKLCARNENWKLERTSKRFYVRFTNIPWYKKLGEYLLNYLCVILLSPVLYQHSKAVILGIERPTFLALLIFEIVVLWFALKFMSEFQFAVVRLNFKDWFLARSHIDSLPYETLLFDIEEREGVFALFITHPNVLINRKGNILSINETEEGAKILKIKVWESADPEEVENVKKIIFDDYQQGLADNPDEHPYFKK